MNSILSEESKDSVFKKVRTYLENENFKIENTDQTRPWGGFFVIAEDHSARFISHFFPHVNHQDIEEYAKLSPKILIVAPRKRLSWQYHHRRAEIWRVVKGTVGVVISDTDEQTPPRTLFEGEHIRLQKGERHRLVGLESWGIVAEIWQHTDEEHPSNEDDIVRLEDDFGR
ncbi:MAG: phosphoheptose isomerase [Balneolaceae bacterium]